MFRGGLSVSCATTRKAAPQGAGATSRGERRLGVRRPRMIPYRACKVTTRVTAASAPSPKSLASLCTSLWRKGFVSLSSSPPSPSRSDPTPTTAAAALGRRRRSRRAPSTLHHGLSSPSGVTRALSSYEWKNMNEYTQRANKEFAKLSKKEIRKVGEEEVDKVEKALKAMEPFNDVFTVRREGLELFVELGPEVGTYWIKFDLSIYQICMMSPRSGAHRYIYDKEAGRWIGEADKHDFQGMLTRDIIQSACGVPDF